MINKTVKLTGLVLAISILANCGGGDDNSNTASGGGGAQPSSDVLAELTETARDAYVFGFPVVENYKFISTYIGPDATEVPNQFVHKSILLTPADREIINPNNDTLNSSAVLDLRREPLVFTFPEVSDRYFSIQLLNLMTENLPLLGGEEEGTTARSVILAGPNWDETSFDNSEGLEVFRSDSELLVAFMRIEVLTSDDLPNAINIQQQVQMETLSDYSGEDAPDEVVYEWPGSFDAQATTDLAFFNYLNILLQFHDLDDTELAALSDFALLGVAPGEVFSESDFSSAELSAISSGVSSARQNIQFPTGFTRREGWNRFNSLVGIYDEDYIFRAIVAWYGLYAMPVDEVVYFNANGDANNVSLNGGSEDYVLTLSPDQVPPANYFWSITVYGPDRFLVDNELDRYSLGNRSESMQYNDDGSLTIYLQQNSPGESLEGNWLPTPGGQFFISVRIYGTSDEILSGEYLLPGIQVQE